MPHGLPTNTIQQPLLVVVHDNWFSETFELLEKQLEFNIERLNTKLPDEEILKSFEAFLSGKGIGEVGTQIIETIVDGEK